MRHGTRQLCDQRTRHGAVPPQLAWFCSAAWPVFAPPLTPGVWQLIGLAGCV